MATKPTDPYLGKLLVVVGPTASGKTALAIELARKFNGEIICADSRTVYKGMDIGTAKPTVPERAAIPHHLLDLVNPNEPFTVADFKELAQKAINEILARGKLPILVGGSGLYIDSVIYDYKLSPQSDPKLREQLEEMTINGLLQYAEEHEIFLGGINRKNPRHIIRTIERGGVVEQQLRLRDNTLVLGIEVPKEVLRQRIINRVDRMVEQGLIQEAVWLSQKYGWKQDLDPIYGQSMQYKNGEVTLGEFKAFLVQKHVNLAKKQQTWFKRNNSIHYLSDLSKAVEYTTTFLNKQS